VDSPELNVVLIAVLNIPVTRSGSN